MIITRKEKRDFTTTEKTVRNRLEKIIRSISTNDVTFLDEIYRLLDMRLETMEEFGSIPLEYVDGRTPLGSKHYRDFARHLRELSELNLVTIPELYTMLKEISDDIFSAGESITESITVCEQLLSKVEGTLKQKMSLSSVKDEILIYDSMLSDEYLDTGTLGVDYRGGFMTLAPASSERIWYEFDEIKFSKLKGKISKPKDSNETLDFFTDGYFNSRMFSASPVFETSVERSTDPINDGYLQTSYMAEYNTLDPTATFGISMKLGIRSQAAAQFGTRRIDQVVIFLDPGDKASVNSTELITPYLSRLSINGVDRTSEVLDNVIMVRGATIGEYERGFQTRSPAVYPTGSFMVCTPDVETVTIDLIADIPQSIWYPEKVVKNDTGNIIHRFNYLETLILNSYEPPDDHPDPRDLYTTREIDEMMEILESGYSSYDHHVELYRFLIGLKDIELFAYTYSTSGVFYSKNLNTHEEKMVAAVELYANEVIPVGTGIKYYISHDKVVWHEVAPVNRAEYGDLPTRIVYNGIETKDLDKHINITSSNVYMKIEMTGERTLSPRLKSYAVRVKLQ